MSRGYNARRITLRGSVRDSVAGRSVAYNRRPFLLDTDTRKERTRREKEGEEQEEEEEMPSSTLVYRSRVALIFDKCHGDHRDSAPCFPDGHVVRACVGVGSVIDFGAGWIRNCRLHRQLLHAERQTARRDPPYQFCDRGSKRLTLRDGFRYKSALFAIFLFFFFFLPSHGIAVAATTSSALVRLQSSNFRVFIFQSE